MFKPYLPGIFIDIEGLDGSGKTSCLKGALKKLNDPDFVYLKAVGSDTVWGRLARKFGSTSFGTFFFLLEVLITTWVPLRRALKSHRIVLMDKYFFNVASHVPEVDTPFNKKLVKFFRRFMFEPDMVIYFTVAMDERIKRLQAGPENKFHQRLAANPDWIIERETAYTRIIRESGCVTIAIDTTTLDIEASTELLSNIVTNYLFSSSF